MYAPNYLLMTAGPTQVRENVLKARSLFSGNPDIDEDFFVFYKNLQDKFSSLVNAKKSKVFFMAGEAMLGLDMACCSLVEPLDKVLVIANGLFGHGFKDLMENYGADVTVYEDVETREINIEKLEEFLINNHDFKVATMVHCDTPTGVLNDVEKISKLLSKYGILSVVDTVAAFGGVPIDIDNSSIDIGLFGSQKALSTPTGITILIVSDKVWECIEKRKTKIPSYYLNLKLWENAVENKYFPYTQASSDLMALDVALDNILEEGLENVFKRHLQNFEYLKEQVKNLKLELFLESGYCPTVLAFKRPKHMEANTIIERLLKEHGILISGSYAHLKNDVLRIGVMGENSQKVFIDKTLKALKEVIK